MSKLKRTIVERPKKNSKLKHSVLDRLGSTFTEGIKQVFKPNERGPSINYSTSAYELITLNYVLRGRKGGVVFAVYKDLNDYLHDLPRSISYGALEKAPTDRDFIMRYISNEEQKIHLDLLVESIRRNTHNKDDQLRIAVSIVQQIPYDSQAVASENNNAKYPYEVLYLNKGICSEKSKLMVYFLRALGFGTSLFSFDHEDHAAVGVKCPVEYSTYHSGYCFIESTLPSIITDNRADYTSIGRLSSTPTIIPISDGISFTSVGEEYNDALEFNRIMEMGKVVAFKHYNKWLKLNEKYGLRTPKDK